MAVNPTTSNPAAKLRTALTNDAPKLQQIEDTKEAERVAQPAKSTGTRSGAPERARVPEHVRAARRARIAANRAGNTAPQRVLSRRLIHPFVKVEYTPPTGGSLVLVSRNGDIFSNLRGKLAAKIAKGVRTATRCGDLFGNVSFAAIHAHVHDEEAEGDCIALMHDGELLWAEVRDGEVHWPKAGKPVENDVLLVFTRDDHGALTVSSGGDADPAPPPDDKALVNAVRERSQSTPPPIPGSEAEASPE